MDQRFYHYFISKLFLYLVFYLLLVTMAVYVVEQFHASESRNLDLLQVFLSLEP